MNSTMASPNSLDYFHSITCLKNKKNPEEAMHILRKVAIMVRPMMKAHGWHCNILEEFQVKGLLGRNHNRGQRIQLCLRLHADEDTFLPWEEIIGTMLHELAHNIQGPHDAIFYKALDDLNIEYDKIVASGYTGIGFDGAGKRLGTKNGGFGPGGTRLGGTLGSLSITNAGRAAAILAAEKRRKTNEIMLPVGGRRLGGGADGSTLPTGGYPLGRAEATPRGFWEKHHTPGELAAIAAERRAKDQLWCGSSPPASGNQEPEDKGGESTSSSSASGIQQPTDSTSGAPASGSQNIGKRKTTVDQNQAATEVVGKKARSYPFNRALESDRPSTSHAPATASNVDTARWSEWSCPSCTLLNRPLALQCDVCMTMRPIDVDA